MTNWAISVGQTENYGPVSKQCLCCYEVCCGNVTASVVVSQEVHQAQVVV